MAVVSELATGVAGLAKTLAVGRPNGYRAGQHTPSPAYPFSMPFSASNPMKSKAILTSELSILLQSNSRLSLIRWTVVKVPHLGLSEDRKAYQIHERNITANEARQC